MKNTKLLGHLMCFIINDCNSQAEFVNENVQEEIQPENIQGGFHAFDIDEVFAN